MTDAGHSDALSAESKRVAPRSPRAALEPEYMPEPNRPSRRARHPLVIAGNAIFTIILVVALAGGLLYSYGKHKLEASGPLDREKVVNIPRGLGLREIADLLARENVIDQPFVFIGGVLVLKAKDDLKYGEYKFAKQITVREAIETIVEGKVVQHAFTIPEGLTSEQIVARLAEVDFLAGNIREVPKEGTLLPETYNFPRGTMREQAIQRMQQAHRRVLQEIWERRNSDLPVKTPEALVTLASIVEKETGRPDERSRVAAVFSNRLRQGIKLQSDPTITYGLVGGKGTLGRPIMRSEIEQPTPYNTYVIAGLPPGPIANPGRAALEAAANPSRTRELYFVADGTGGHSFSESLDQHQRNVSRLRQIEQQQKPAVDQSPAGAANASAPPAAPPATSSGQSAPAQTPPARPQAARSRQPTAQS